MNDLKLYFKLVKDLWSLKLAANAHRRHHVRFNFNLET